MPFKGKLGEIQSFGHAARYGDQERKGKRTIPVKCRKEPAPPIGGKMGMMYLVIKNRGFILPRWAKLGERIGLKVRDISGRLKQNKNGTKIKGKREGK